MRKYLLLSTFASVAALLVFACSDDRSSNSLDQKVPVSGTVSIYSCTFLSRVEPPPDDDDIYSDTSLYSVETGRVADIVFVGVDGCSTMAQTDDSSAFAVSVVPGLYTIRVETDHTRPDLFDSVMIAADTNLPLVIRYDFTHTNLIYIGFCDQMAMIGEDAEREYLRKLDDSIGGMLIVEDAMRFHPPQEGSCVLYRIHTTSEFRLWEVIEAVVGQLFISGDFPDNVIMSLPTYGLCPEDFVVIGWDPGDPGDSSWTPPEIIFGDTIFIPPNGGG